MNPESLACVAYRELVTDLLLIITLSGMVAIIYALARLLHHYLPLHDKE